MTPRTQIEWLDLDDSEEENRHKIRNSAYSRFPVAQGGPQQVELVPPVLAELEKRISGSTDSSKS